MSNMSYCRFQNTLHALRDCRGALEDLFEPEDEEHREAILSREEAHAASELIELAIALADKWADHDGPGSALEALDQMKHGTFTAEAAR